MTVSGSHTTSSLPRVVAPTRDSADARHVVGERQTRPGNEETQDSKNHDGNPVVRFYFIRHGETEANENGIVVGQGDSALTADGMKLARALGETELMRKEQFWRKYASDLGRAQTTARLILGEDISLEKHGVQLEPRLRELAKGAREGLLKKVTYKEAQTIYRGKHGDDKPFPLLETEEAVWERVRHWLFEVVGDVVRQYRVECQASLPRSPHVYSVFVVLHAGTLRTALKYLVPEQMPTSVDLSPQTSDGSTSRHLKVPNTSVTIVDVVPLNALDEIWDGERVTQASPIAITDICSVKLHRLTWTGHYDQV